MGSWKELAEAAWILVKMRRLGDGLEGGGVAGKKVEKC